jgi:hypothetical protein
MTCHHWEISEGGGFYGGARKDDNGRFFVFRLPHKTMKSIMKQPHEALW